MIIQNIFIFIVSVFTILLGVMIYVKHRKSPSNFWYLWMCVFGGAWGLMKVVQFSVLDIYWHNLLISRFVMIFGALAPLAYFLFTYNFIYKDKNLSKNILFFTVFFSITLSILYLFNILGHAHIYITNGILQRDIMLFDFSIFALYFFIYIFFSLSILFKKYKIAESVHKIQIKYLMIGTILTFLTTGFVSVVLLLFNNFTYDWLGPIFLSIHISIVGYFLFITHRVV